MLRCELDAAYFHLYLGSPSDWGGNSPQLREMFPAPRDAVDYIMETFPIVKRKDIARTEVKDDKGKNVTMLPEVHHVCERIAEFRDDLSKKKAEFNARMVSTTLIDFSAVCMIFS